MNIDKPDELKLKEIPERILNYGTELPLAVRIVQKMCYMAGWEAGVEVQLDADVAYYEPLIQQARQETDAISYAQGVLDGREGKKDARFNVTSYSVNVGTIKSEGKWKRE